MSGTPIPGMLSQSDEQTLADEAFRVHGKIVHNASLAGVYMYEIFHHYAGAKRAVSQAIFYTLDSTKAQETLTARTARAAGADPVALKEIQALGVAIGKVMEDRNRIAHSFLLQDDPIFSDGGIKLVNPKSAHSGRGQSRSAGQALPADPESDSGAISPSSLQQSLRASDAHLRAATLVFRRLCQSNGRKTQVTVSLS